MMSDYQADNSVLAQPENFKGIVYVRLSTLPADQGLKIRESGYRHSIIKILNGELLMADCMIYDDYLKWLEVSSSTIDTIQKTTPIPLEASNHEFMKQ
jgi:hypothetical protein